MDPFLGASKSQLEVWLTIAQEDYAAGKTLSEAGAGDANARNLVQMTPLQRIERLLAKLHLIDPSNYPAADIQRVTRTKIMVAANAN